MDAIAARIDEGFRLFRLLVPTGPGLGVDRARLARLKDGVTLGLPMSASETVDRRIRSTVG